jgi:hypothetical protein
LRLENFRISPKSPTDHIISFIAIINLLVGSSSKETVMLTMKHVFKPTLLISFVWGCTFASASSHKKDNQADIAVDKAMPEKPSIDASDLFTENGVNLKAFNEHRKLYKNDIFNQFRLNTGIKFDINLLQTVDANLNFGDSVTVNLDPFDESTEATEDITTYLAQFPTVEVGGKVTCFLDCNQGLYNGYILMSGGFVTSFDDDEEDPSEILGGGTTSCGSGFTMENTRQAKPFLTFLQAELGLQEASFSCSLEAAALTSEAHHLRDRRINGPFESLGVKNIDVYDISRQEEVNATLNYGDTVTLTFGPEAGYLAKFPSQNVGREVACSLDCNNATYNGLMALYGFFAPGLLPDDLPEFNETEFNITDLDLIFFISTSCDTGFTVRNTRQESPFYFGVGHFLVGEFVGATLTCTAADGPVGPGCLTRLWKRATSFVSRLWST